MFFQSDVVLTSTTASPSAGASANGLPLFEGKSGQVIYFDATLNSDVTGGSVPSGTDHWQFTVSPGSTTAALTQAQKDSLLTAGTPLTFTRIMVSKGGYGALRGVFKSYTGFLILGENNTIIKIKNMNCSSISI